jgi:hypothetical protein
VGHRLEEIAARPVHLGHGDEGAPQVVAAALTELQEVEVGPQSWTR